MTSHNIKKRDFNGVTSYTIDAPSYWHNTQGQEAKQEMTFLASNLLKKRKNLSRSRRNVVVLKAARISRRLKNRLSLNHRLNLVLLLMSPLIALEMLLKPT